MQLLGEVEAWLAILEHRNDRSQMTFGPLEALDDIGVTNVPHAGGPIPPR